VICDSLNNHSSTGIHSKGIEETSHCVIASSIAIRLSVIRKPDEDLSKPRSFCVLSTFHTVWRMVKHSPPVCVGTRLIKDQELDGYHPAQAHRARDPLLLPIYILGQYKTQLPMMKELMRYTFVVILLHGQFHIPSSSISWRFFILEISGLRAEMSVVPDRLVTLVER